jgi:hypothetical protein
MNMSRYVLDGDRHELDRIRNELSMLKLHAATAPAGSREHVPPRAPPIRAQDYDKKARFPSFAAAHSHSSSSESKSFSPVNVSDNAVSVDGSRFLLDEDEDEDEDDSAPDPATVIHNIRRELSTLLSSGFYDDQNDELIQELKRNLASVEGMPQSRTLL